MGMVLKWKVFMFLLVLLLVLAVRIMQLDIIFESHFLAVAKYKVHKMMGKRSKLQCRCHALATCGAGGCY